MEIKYEKENLNDAVVKCSLQKSTESVIYIPRGYMTSIMFAKAYLAVTENMACDIEIVLCEDGRENIAFDCSTGATIHFIEWSRDYILVKKRGDANV